MRSNYWIKLYQSLLDNMFMGKLSDSAWRRCIEIYLLAAGRDSSEAVTNDLADLAWELRVSEDQLFKDLAELDKAGFISLKGEKVFVTGSLKCQAATAGQISSGYVYLAYAGTGHYKIGRSSSPNKRIKIFDTIMPIEVAVIHAFEADDARGAEKELHQRYSDKRGAGEWFSLIAEDVNYISRISRYEDGSFYVWKVVANDEELPY